MLDDDPDSTLPNWNSTTIPSPNFTTNGNLLEAADGGLSNWWALSAIGLVIGTAAGNILVCLAIYWERRLQNVTNYFLMSLAITDLMVAILVMPLGIYTMFQGYFALPSIYCLAWMCLDVLFCTASIMHLCTISVDRYLSLRYPMKFGRNKSRRRVILKIVFVWLLSIAMSMPLSLMYSKDQDSLIIDGSCQIPDPLYKFIGSIICFYIPLLVMLVTYALTVKLLANQKQSLSTPDWSSNWMGGPGALERRYTWRKLLNATRSPGGHQHSGGGSSKLTTPQHTVRHHHHHHHHHHHSATSTDTELTALDTHELWIQESEPKPCTVSALGQFGAEMFKLSRGLQEAAAAAAVASAVVPPAQIPPPPLIDSPESSRRQSPKGTFKLSSDMRSIESLTDSHSLLLSSENSSPWQSKRRRRASTFHEGDSRDECPSPRWRRKRGASFHEILYPKSQLSSEQHDEDNKEENRLDTRDVSDCDTTDSRSNSNGSKLLDVEKTTSTITTPSPTKKSSLAKTNASTPSTNNIMVTWESRRSHRRGSSFGTTRATLVTNSPLGTQRTPLLLRRSATLRQNGHGHASSATLIDRNKNPSSPCLLRYNNYSSTGNTTATSTRSVRSHHSRNSSVISRNSSRHGRIIRLEQKATKVLGVVFFTFVILWAPFFILNLVPTFCSECDKNIDNWMVQLVTWLGYASSMVNPIFYTIFNKVFRQAFKKVLTCKYRKTAWRPHR